MTQFALIELAHITPSLTNPRKHFNPDKLLELALSIKTTGLHQPVLLRPLPAARVPDTDRHITHELVAGERRYRASLQAQLASIPAMIRDLSDAQVLEIQIIENLQRDDLSELEEAEGYEQLMKHSYITADQVGEKIGKSRSYVYARLKLLDLSSDCKQALAEGRIDSSRALLIARIPDTKLQIKALKFATAASGYPPEPPSVRSLQEWLKNNVMLKLDEAIFKITDARLLEAAGSCNQCPKRTGANPDLFSEVQNANICTDPKCFHDKEEAHRAALMKKAEAKGLRIVQGEEAKEMLSNMWRDTPDDYDQLHQKREDLGEEGARVITLAQALGKDAPEPILFIHPRTQAITELVPRAASQAVLLAKGLIKEGQDRDEEYQDPLEELNQLRHDVDREIRVLTIQATHSATQEAIRATTKAQASKLISPEVLRAWLLNEIDIGGANDMAELCAIDLPEDQNQDEAMAHHLQQLGETDVLRTAALALLDLDNGHWSNEKRLIKDAFINALDIDTKAIERTVKAEVKKEYADRIKTVQAKIDAQKAPQKTAIDTKTAPGSAAQAKAGAGGETPAPPLRKRGQKLGAQEAQQGIAAAMQEVDAASAVAVAPPEPEALGVGDKVVVLDTFGQDKRHGKHGKLTSSIEAGWWVNFGGRAGSELIAAEHLRKVF